MIIAEKSLKGLLISCSLFSCLFIAAACGQPDSDEIAAGDALSGVLIGTGLTAATNASGDTPSDTTTSPAFYDVGDGTVVSSSDALMWAKCQQGTGSTNLFASSQFCSGTRGEFQFCDQNGDCNANGAQSKITPPFANSATSPAYNSCEGLVLAGHDDWRLPTRQELARFFYNLYLNDTSSPLVFPNAYKSGVPDSVDNFNWSTTGTGAATTGWAMSGFNGEITARAQGNAYYVRCVRDN